MLPEPYKIKAVERIKLISKEERSKLLRKAGYNIFGVPAESVFIDLLTDSGTSAMSDDQWAGLNLGDESYAGSENWYNFESTIKEMFGYKHVIPTHQGRAAENILFSTILKKGDYVPSNMHFDTTKANIEANGGEAVDLVIDKAYDTELEIPFKGNLDPKKLKSFIERVGRERIPLCMITITNNSGGGQPVSLKNVVEIKKVLKEHEIPLFFDACRFAENAYFVKMREKEYREKSIKEIVLKMFSYGDGCTMSAKKDGLSNIGGFLALNDTELAEKLKSKLILIEGFPTYGGLAGRDLEVISRGLREVLDFDYLNFRVKQVEFLGRLISDAKVPIIKPVGGHAIYLDAKKFLPHIPQSELPGQTLVCELYLNYGIRCVELGTIAFAKEKEGEVIYPKLELVRLAIPRRVYTNDHMRYVAKAVIEIYKKREKLKGMRYTKKPERLRHFTARFEPL